MIDLLNQLPTSHTHCCPRCGSPTVCGVEQGKSNCWCFHMPRALEVPAPEQNERCLCRRCLEETLRQGEQANKNEAVDFWPPQS